MAFSLERYGISGPTIRRNPSVAVPYEAVLQQGREAPIASSGALIAYSGHKTGRSPADKRLLEEADAAPNIRWGELNVKVDGETLGRGSQRLSNPRTGPSRGRR